MKKKSPFLFAILLALISGVRSQAQTNTQLVMYLMWTNGSPVNATVTLTENDKGVSTTITTGKTCCSTGWITLGIPVGQTAVYTVAVNAPATSTTPALNYSFPFTRVFFPSNTTLTRAELHITFPVTSTNAGSWRLITSGGF
jgi:hypothetical protein